MRFVVSATLFFSLASSLIADDWPQWMGPKRDSVWRELGIMKRFPKTGLKPKWKAPVQYGYAGPAVAGDKVLVTDYVIKSGKMTNNPGSRDKLTGMERVLCLDFKNGKQLWEHKYECAYSVSYPGGPRCTPTVDGDRVYTLGTMGDLYCLKTENGDVVWKKSFTQDYGAKTPIWGFAAHPLVHGDLVYCVVGGKGSVAVAFNKHTGKEVWRNLSAPQQGYCPPTMIQHGGVEQLLIWHPQSINSLNPKTGKVYWSEPLRPDFGMSISAPRLEGDKLFGTGYRSTATMFELTGGKPSAKVLWEGGANRGIFCSNSTPFLEDGVIYGVDGNDGALIAASMKDGKRFWEEMKPVSNARLARHGTAFIVKHQDRFILFNEEGDLILANMTAKKYQELSRANILTPTNTTFGRKVVWSHPAFAHRCVFARNDRELVCVSLAAE